MSTVNLIDPRNPSQVETFPITKDFPEVLSERYKRKIVGLYDAGDRVYFPTRFVLLNPAYFSSRSKLLVLSDVNVVARKDNNVQVSVVNTDDQIEPEESSLTVKIARQIFTAIGLCQLT
jgi:hypothetical protein